MMNTGKVQEVDEVGWFAPRPRPAEKLTSGEVGYVTAAIKNVVDARVGDTITTAEHGATAPLPGYRQVKPMVFAGLLDRKSTRLNSSHSQISYAVFCLKKKKRKTRLC